MAVTRYLIFVFAVVFLAADPCVLVGLTAGEADDDATSDAAMIFEQANAAFQQKRFDEARQYYEALVSRGIAAAELFYNLGTTYAHLGDTARAVLYLERARRLAPRDRDILANLRLVEPPMNRASEKRWLIPLLTFRFDEWFMGFLLAYVIGMIGLAVWLWLPRRQRPRWLSTFGVAWAAVCVVLGIASAWSYYFTEVQCYAVVLRQGTVVRSGPEERFPELLQAPEGMKLLVEPYRDPEWRVVRLPDGQLGYVRSTELLEI